MPFSMHFSCDVSEVISDIGLWEDSDGILMAPEEYVKVGASEIKYVSDDNGNWFFEVDNNFWVNMLPSGLWRLNSKIAVRNLILNDAHELNSSDITIADNNLKCRVTVTSPFLVDGGDFTHLSISDISTSDIFITNNQILRLYENKNGILKDSPTIKPNNGHYERHAMVREYQLACILNAVFQILENESGDYPKEMNGRVKNLLNAEWLYGYINIHNAKYNIKENSGLTASRVRDIIREVKQHPSKWKIIGGTKSNK